MAWFKRMQTPKVKGEAKSSVPTGLWIRCPSCSGAHLAEEVAQHLQLCPGCGHHFRLGARERLAAFFDQGRFREEAADLESTDPLTFKDSKRYPDRIRSAQKNAEEKDAFVLGVGLLNGVEMVAGSFEFRFLGGSMGSVVGEKVTRAFELGIEKKCPVVIFSASGGARMQEGILSLMQMAKTSAAISRFREVGRPYFSVLTDPTTGGVAASFALLGDVIIAEPNALIGFAGPRVIEQTIRQKLPEGFQRSEFLLDHGMVDMIVPRSELRDRIALLTELTQPNPRAQPS
jgi:acetyl-CoA carboxylase carboxyl transferase subunit beta